MDDIARVIAHQQIRDLAHRYAVAIDARDLDALVALYVDDVRVGEQHGHEALRAFFDQTLRGVGITILNVGTHVVDFDDDRHATGLCYTLGQVQAGDRWIWQSILYRDRYLQTPAGWRFARQRDHRLWYGADVGVNPLVLHDANWPEHHDGMGDVPAAVFPTWAAFWDRTREA